MRFDDLKKHLFLLNTNIAYLKRVYVKIRDENLVNLSENFNKETSSLKKGMIINNLNNNIKNN